MRREFSAGGVLVRRMRGRWWLAAIRPRGKPVGTWALPKGLVEAHETPLATAARETFEETGVRPHGDVALGDVGYVYTWGGERVAKRVSFFLFTGRGGRLGQLPPGMEAEVAAARWLPLDDAPTLLAYRGEREVARRAAVVLAERGG